MVRIELNRNFKLAVAAREVILEPPRHTVEVCSGFQNPNKYNIFLKKYTKN